MKTNWKCHCGGWGWWGKKHVWSGICRVFLCLFARNLLFPFLLDRANGIQIDVLGIWTLVSQNSTNTNIEKEMGERRQENSLYWRCTMFMYAFCTNISTLYVDFILFSLGLFFFSLSLTLPLSPSLFLSLRRSFCRFAVQTCFTFIYQAHFVQLRSIRFKCYFCRSMSFSHSNAIFYRVRTHSRKSCHRSINSYF